MNAERRSLADILKTRTPRPAKLGHVVLRTGQLAALKQWYLALLERMSRMKTRWSAS